MEREKLMSMQKEIGVFRAPSFVCSVFKMSLASRTKKKYDGISFDGLYYKGITAKLKWGIALLHKIIL